MEASYRNVILRFKSLILAVIFMGIMMLVISYLLAPDKNEQVLNTLNYLGGLLIMLPVFLIILFFVMKEMTKLNR